MKTDFFKPSLKTVEDAIDIWQEWRGKKIPLALFFALCFNLLVAPLVFAATAETLTRPQAWSLGLLGLGTVALSIYLFVVMFAPEKF